MVNPDVRAFGSMTITHSDAMYEMPVGRVTIVSAVLAQRR